MRSLYAAGIAGVMVLTLTELAFAGCLNDVTLPGSVGAKSIDQRSFTLSRPGAVIGVKTVKPTDKLSFKVSRPSGAEACKLHGPSKHEVCFPTIRNKSGEGVHTIYVINKLNRAVNYKLTCKSR